MHDERRVTVNAGGRELWSGMIGRTLRRVKLRGVELAPGGTAWRFDSDKPPVLPANGDLRAVTFSLRNLEVNVTSRAPPLK